MRSAGHIFDMTGVWFSPLLKYILKILSLTEIGNNQCADLTTYGFFSTDRLFWQNLSSITSFSCEIFSRLRIKSAKKIRSYITIIPYSAGPCGPVSGAHMELAGKFQLFTKQFQFSWRHLIAAYYLSCQLLFVMLTVNSFVMSFIMHVIWWWIPKPQLLCQHHLSIHLSCHLSGSLRVTLMHDVCWAYLLSSDESSKTFNNFFTINFQLDFY